MSEQIHLCGSMTPSKGKTELYDLSVTERGGRPAVLWSVTWHGGQRLNSAEDVVYVPREIYSYITPAIFGAWLKHSLLPVVAELVDWATVAASEELEEWCREIRDYTECR